jgi:hypothetical protein
MLAPIVAVLHTVPFHKMVVEQVHPILREQQEAVPTYSNYL